jgi:prefoldin subunit 5
LKGGGKNNSIAETEKKINNFDGENENNVLVEVGEGISIRHDLKQLQNQSTLVSQC